MEKNKKIGIMIAVISVLIIAVLGSVYYFTEIKLYDNGFNGNGVRKLTLNRKPSWYDINLGTYILEIEDKTSSNKYKITVREKQFDDYYEEKLKEFIPFTNSGVQVGNFYYRDGLLYNEEEIKDVITDEIKYEFYDSWKDYFTFKDVEIEIEIKLSQKYDIYNSLKIALNEDGSIKDTDFYANDNDLKKIIDEEKENILDRDVSIQVAIKDTDGYNYTIKNISGSVER